MTHMEMKVGPSQRIEICCNLCRKNIKNDLMVLLIIMAHGERDAYNEVYMLYNELYSQIDKNRKIEVAGTPL